MVLFGKSREIKRLREESDIPERFVAVIANAIQEDFYDDEMNGQYIMANSSKVVGITAADVIPIKNKNQTEVKFSELMPGEENLIGLGKSWFNRMTVMNIVSALEAFEIPYRIFINPAEPFPLLISTKEGNISIAPFEP